MINRYLLVLPVLALLPGIATAQDAKAIVADSAKAMGVPNLATLGSFMYSGSGSSYEFGQGAANTPGPKSAIVSYRRAIDFDAAGSIETIVAAAPGATAGKEEKTIRRIPFVEPYGAHGKQYEIWITPLGFLKSALKSSDATIRSVTEAGKTFNVVSFSFEKKYRISGYIGADHLLDHITTRVDDPVLGDMTVEAKFSAYKEFRNGFIFPSRIQESAGGFPVLDLTVADAVKNAIAPVNETYSYSVAGEAGVPSFRGPLLGKAPPISVDQLLFGDDIYYFGVKEGSRDDPGDTFHTVVFNFNDYLVVVEAPLDETHADAVIREIRKIYGDKAIRYVVNTHVHFESTGGLRAYAAEGATIITQDANKAFLEKALTAPRTISPDRLTASKKRVVIEGVAEKRVITDGTHSLELYHAPSSHVDGLLMAYAPKQKLLIESDLYIARDPEMAVDDTGHISNLPKRPGVAYAGDLTRAIDRLKLDVSDVLCLQGRPATKAEMLQDIAAAAH